MAVQSVSFQILGTSVALHLAIPENCPVCHRWVNVGIIGPTHHSAVAGLVKRLYVVFRCPSSECDTMFLGIYEGDGWRLGSTPLPSASAWRRTLSPKRVEARKFEAMITTISPNFERIFQQAEIAESHGLDLICGAGYRKSLEFLLKDFLKSIGPSKAQEIEKKQLGALLQEPALDPRLKATASRATWLGNDETHYLRKWADKDLADLKKLIELTIHWIEADILTRELEKSMPSSGPPPPSAP